LADLDHDHRACPGWSGSACLVEPPSHFTYGGIGAAARPTTGTGRHKQYSGNATALIGWRSLMPVIKRHATCTPVPAIAK